MSLPPLPPGTTLDDDLPPLPAGAKLDDTSPLDKALTEQSGDVVTVETPTGPAQFTRGGQRFYGKEESQRMVDSGEPALRQRALEGATSFLSGGGALMDEIRGAGAAVGPKALNQRFSNWLDDKPNEPIGDTYRRVRDDTRRTVDEATANASPNIDIKGVKIPVLPAAGAALPSVFAPMPASFAGRVGLSAFQGAGAAGADSRADLTQGDAKGLARDTAAGGTLGAVGGAAAELLGAPLRWLSRRTGAEANAAKGAVQGQIQKTRDAAMQSARGQLGNNTAVQGNSMESVVEVLNSPERFTPETVEAAQALVDSPEGQALLNRAVMNNIEKAKAAMAAEPELRSALSAATTEAQAPAVTSEVARRLEPSSVASDLGEKAWNSVGQRAVLSGVGAGLGGLGAMATGHDFSTGAMAGGLSGYATPGTLQFLRNQSRNPAIQHTVNAYMERVLNGGASTLSREGAAFAPAAMAGGGNKKKPTLTEEEAQAVYAFGTTGK